MRAYEAYKWQSYARNPSPMNPKPLPNLYTPFICLDGIHGREVLLPDSLANSFLDPLSHPLLCLLVHRRLPVLVLRSPIFRLHRIPTPVPTD